MTCLIWLNYEHFLDIRVTRTCKYMHLGLTVYAVKVLNMFEAFFGTTQKTRKNAVYLIAQEQRELSEEQERWLDNSPYRSLLGALLYLSMNTRPDMSYAVGSLLLRFGSLPTVGKCKLMVYALQYLRGTVHKGH